MENADEEKEETPDLNLELALGLAESEENQDDQPLSMNNDSIVQEEEVEENEVISNETLNTTTTVLVVEAPDVPDEIEMENVQEILWTVPPSPSATNSVINVVEESSGGGNEDSVIQQIRNEENCLKIDINNLHCYLCSQTFPNIDSFSTHHHYSADSYTINESGHSSMDSHDDLLQVKLESSDGDGNGENQENFYINDDITVTKYVISGAASTKRKTPKKRKSKSNRPFECELCGRTFMRKSDATRHKTFSHQNKSTKTSQKSSSMQPLGEITNTACLSNKDQVDVTCNKCFNTFVSLKEFNEHLYQVKTSTCKTESTPSSFNHRKGSNGKFFSAKSTSATISSLKKEYNEKNLGDTTQEEEEIDQDENFPPFYEHDNDDDFFTPSKEKSLTIENKKKYSTRRQKEEGGKSGKNKNVDEGNKYCKICDKEFRSVKLCENHMRVNHTKVELEQANNDQENYHDEEGEETTSKTRHDDSQVQSEPESESALIAVAMAELERAEKEEQEQGGGTKPKRRKRNWKPFHIIYERCDDDFSPAENSDAESDSSLHSGPVRKKWKRNSGMFKKKRVPPSERPPPNYRFTCEYCGKSFKEATELRRHDQLNKRAADYADEVHAEENLMTNPNWYKERFTCPYMCGAPPFEFKCQMKVHTQSHRIPGSKPHKCVLPGCPKAFHKINALKCHMMIHSGEKPFLCQICGRSFASKSAYNFHMRKHELMEKGNPFKCTYPGCTRFFYTMGHLKRHSLSHMPEKPFKCIHGICNRSFRTKSELNVHVNIHTGENIYKCPEPNCEKQFKIKLSLQTHIKIHHPKTPAEGGSKEFKCTHIPAGTIEQCGKIFPNEFALKSHLKRHEKWEKNPDIICQYPDCKKMFRNESNMKQHIKAIHEGVRNFLCPDCGKSFFHNGGFRRHLRTHTGEKPYKCPVEDCPYSCNAPSQLSEHTATHENKKSFKCTFEDCLYSTKGFNARSSLRRHLLVHTGLKPHKCPFPSCTAAYPESRNLKRHIAKNHYTSQQQEQAEVVVPMDTRIYIPDPNTIPEPQIEYQIYYQEEEEVEEGEEEEEGNDDESD